MVLYFRCPLATACSCRPKMLCPAGQAADLFGVGVLVETVRVAAFGTPAPAPADMRHPGLTLHLVLAGILLLHNPQVARAGFFDGISNAISSAAGSVSSAATTAVSTVENTTSSAVNTVTNGVNTAASSVSGALNTATGAVQHGFDKATG